MPTAVHTACTRGEVAVEARDRDEADAVEQRASGSSVASASGAKRRTARCATSRGRAPRARNTQRSAGMSGRSASSEQDVAAGGHDDGEQAERRARGVRRRRAVGDFTAPPAPGSSAWSAGCSWWRPAASSWSVGRRGRGRGAVARMRGRRRRRRRRATRTSPGPSPRRGRRAGADRRRRSRCAARWSGSSRRAAGHALVHGDAALVAAPT